MENSALPVHITVINPAAAKPAQALSATPGAASATGDATKEFSDLLNTQKLLKAAANNAGGLSSDAAKSGDSAGLELNLKPAPLTDEDPAAKLGAAADIVLLLPVVAQLAPQGLKAIGNAGAEAATRSLNTDTLALLKPDTEPWSQTVGAAKDAAQPAKLASTEKPSSQVSELLPKLDVPETNNPFAAQIASVQTPKTNSALPLAQPTVISVPVGETGWDRAFSQRVTWMATSDQQTARIELNPPNLGPLEVRISLHHDQASAMFSSPHGAVRDAIEAALPKLREMLAESGLTMGNVNVSAQFSQNQQQAQSQQQADRRGQFHINLPAELAPLVATPNASKEKRGLVDIFA